MISSNLVECPSMSLKATNSHLKWQTGQSCFKLPKELLRKITKELRARGLSPDVLEIIETSNLIRNNYFGSERVWTNLYNFKLLWSERFLFSHFLSLSQMFDLMVLRGRTVGEVTRILILISVNKEDWKLLETTEHVKTQQDSTVCELSAPTRRQMSAPWWWTS